VIGPPKTGPGPVRKLEWTLPDVRAMLFIPDDPADEVGDILIINEIGSNVMGKLPTT